MDSYRRMRVPGNVPLDYLSQPSTVPGVQPQVVQGPHGLVVISHGNQALQQPNQASLHHMPVINQQQQNPNVAPVLRPALSPQVSLAPPQEYLAPLQQQHSLPIMPSRSQSPMIPPISIPPVVPAIGITSEELSLKHQLQTRLFDNQMQQIMNQLPRLPSAEPESRSPIPPQRFPTPPPAPLVSHQPAIPVELPQAPAHGKMTSFDSFGSLFNYGDDVEPLDVDGLTGFDIDHLLMDLEFMDTDAMAQLSAPLEQQTPPGFLMRSFRSEMSDEPPLTMERRQSLRHRTHPPQKYQPPIQKTSSKPKKSNLYGTLELHGREELRRIRNSRQKLMKLRELWKQVPARTTQLNEAAYTFYRKTLKPVMTCLNNHFSGSIDDFLATYPDFTMTNFKNHCCGKGANCNVRN